MKNYDIIAEQKYNDLAIKILVPAFREILLTYSVTSSLVYDALETYSGETELYDEYVAGRKELADKYRLRLSRLIKRLSLGTTSDNSEKAFFCKKVFDSSLSKGMVKSYCYLADALGDKTTLSFSEKTLIHSIDIIDRIGFSFVEFAAILCLFSSVKGRSLEALNRPIATENELKRAKPRFRKIKEVMFSNQYEYTLILLLMDLLAEYYQGRYENMLNLHLKDFWLPQKYRHLKSNRYVLQRYGNEIVSNDAYPKTEFEQLSECEQMRLCQENEELMRMQWLFFVIMPVVEAFAINAIPVDIDSMLKPEDMMIPTISLKKHLVASDAIPSKTKKHINNMPSSKYEVSFTDFCIAQRLYCLMKDYVNEVRKDVSTLLETLPEAEIAGEQGMWNYLISI